MKQFNNIIIEKLEQERYVIMVYEQRERKRKINLNYVAFEMLIKICFDSRQNLYSLINAFKVEF